LILNDFLATFGCKRVNCNEMDGDGSRAYDSSCSQVILVWSDFELRFLVTSDEPIAVE